MKIDFYFDPSCPWCWVTSRWLLMVSGQRDLDIDWRLFSLAYVNDELKNKEGGEHLPSHRVERLMLAVKKQGVNILDLYTALGIKHFLSGEEYTDSMIEDVLKQLNLSGELINSASDSSLDPEIIASSEEAKKVVGQDIGVPTIVFNFDNQVKKGFFGPVLKELPAQEESVKLWDSIVELAKNDSFCELKRGRDSDPDVYSTAKC